MTAHRPVRRHWLQAKTNANEGCNSCASVAGLVLSFIVCFIACFILHVIAPLVSVDLRGQSLQMFGGNWSSNNQDDRRHCSNL